MLTLLAGYTKIYSTLCYPFSSLIVVYFRVFEPELVRERKAGRLRRRRFWAAGVNDILAVDQHDKWKRFGLALHTGIDPFAGRIQWMKVWWTNNNPKVVLSFYLESVEKTGCKCSAYLRVSILSRFRVFTKF